jgi:hypothetical protein
MELPSDQVLDFAGRRRKHKGQAVELGVHRGYRIDAAGGVLDDIVRLADNEAKGEDELVLVGELEQECGPSTGFRLDILK